MGHMVGTPKTYRSWSVGSNPTYPPAEQVEVKRRSKAIYIEFKMVKLATLKIPDDVYQRPSSTRAVNRMVEEGWDDGLQSVLLISAETDNVLDGAHRVRAARRLGIVQLPALVEPRSIIYYMGEIVDELPAHLRKVASNVVQLVDFRRLVEIAKPLNNKSDASR